MCGIAGALYRAATRSEAIEKNLEAMLGPIFHRGPDAGGTWSDAQSGIGLAHRRLAIVDLSEAGRQPMVSKSGRYTIVFNGEIYNHPQIRIDVGATEWRGHSDTETLLAGFDKWGIQATVQKAVGMFAFAVWDAQTHKLILCRDRMGEKPLYYGWFGTGNNRTFLFGSDLAALRAHPAFEAPVDRNALCTFLRFNCIGQDQSIYAGVNKLLPGTILEVSDQESAETPTAYWSFASAVAAGKNTPFAGSATEAVDRLEALIRASLAGQMVADVPLGAFLSGGVDSSAIVALMQTQSERPIKTFTIGFEDRQFNEAIYAKDVAHHLGTDHTELYVTAEQARAVIPDLPRMYSEPFADSSQIPTALVSQLARQHVTVALSGDAGDELFGGYNRYLMTDKLWGKLSKIPAPLRRVLAKAIYSASPAMLNKLFGFLPMSHPGDKLHKGAALLDSGDIDELYLRMVSQWNDPASVVIGGHDVSRSTAADMRSAARISDIEHMMAVDTLTYLPDDILTKVDRAAMAFSLETRVPLLDHNIVEFAWSLPLDVKLRNGTGKWPLREVLYRHVPKSLIERPKMGFGVPLGDWLRGPLREWGADLLSSARLHNDGFFDQTKILAKWDEHQSGKRNWQHQLWCILMFQAWLVENPQSQINAQK